MNRLGSFEGYGNSLTFGNQLGACDAEQGRVDKLLQDRQTIVESGFDDELPEIDSQIQTARNTLTSCQGGGSTSAPPAPSGPDPALQAKIAAAEQRASDAEQRLAEAQRQVDQARASNNRAEMDAAVQRLDAMAQRLEDAQKALKEVKQEGLSDFTKLMIGAGVMVGLLIFVFFATQSGGRRYRPPPPGWGPPPRGGWQPRRRP